MKADAPGRRFFVVVPVKVARLATARNRIRRRIREIVRSLPLSIPSGYRLIISVHSAALPPHQELRERVVALLKKSGMMLKS